MKVVDELEERIASWEWENQREICYPLRKEFPPVVKKTVPEKCSIGLGQFLKRRQQENI
jgi:hypothetical protein